MPAPWKNHRRITCLVCRAAIECGFESAAITIHEPDTERELEVGDRLRHDRLRMV